MKNVIAVFAVALVVGFAATAGAATWTEDFDSGFTGTAVGNHPDWGPGGAGPTPTAGSGVGGSVGLPDHNQIFTWTAHPFSWTNDLSVGDYVVAQMDFQTDNSAHLDDDRVGWMIKDDTTGSDNIFGIQMDPGGGGYNIECYWDANSWGDNGGRTSIVTLPQLSANAWYRLQADITKLTATSAKIDVSLAPVDGAGNAGAPVATGTIADTSALGGSSPMTEYFTGLAGYGNTLWPGYKNHSAIRGAVDNAGFAVIPEPSTLVLAAFGLMGLLVLAWRRRS